MTKKLISILALILLSTALWAAELKDIKQELKDSFITTKITTQYTESKLLNPLKIHVKTLNGVVTLTGHVKSRKAFVKALKIAGSTSGVSDVNTTKLTIRKVNTVFTDTFITAKVEAAVLKAKILDDESIPLTGINAHTVNGVVTLKGKLKNRQASKALIKRVKSIKGVKKVISYLKICEKKS